ncbi:MAG: DUF1329 domain-containing protein [Deltaproteobacteria bacterium]|nr:DUF1329 domain-containing protein [Deltaproteobacteria bacterium]
MRFVSRDWITSRMWCGHALGGSARARSILFVCVLVSGLAFGLWAEAETQKEASGPSQTAAELPEAGKGYPQGLLINSSNASAYKGLIVPGLYGDVRAGKLEFDAVRRLPYEWSFDEDWKNAKTLSPKALGAQGALAPTVRWDRGFVWGDRTRLSREKSLDKLAAKLLWNVHSNFWSQKIVTLAFSLKEFSQSGGVSGWELQGDLSRVYPGSLVPDDKTGQLFREIIRLRAPAPLAGYAWLTFRFLGADEDVVYIFSPALEKPRELTASNREDGFAASALSVDDFFVWSGKPSLLALVDLKKITALTPLAVSEQGRARSQGKHCALISASSSPETEAQQLHQPDSFQGGVWPGGNLIYAPRELWRMELVSSDPFSLYGRQVLYVDSESMLPVFKFVYDQGGVFWKSIVGAIGLAQGEGQRAYPFIASQIIRDYKAGKVWRLNYSNIRYCRQFPDGLELGAFQPGRLGPK